MVSTLLERPAAFQRGKTRRELCNNLAGTKIPQQQFFAEPGQVHLGKRLAVVLHWGKAGSDHAVKLWLYCHVVHVGSIIRQIEPADELTFVGKLGQTRRQPSVRAAQEADKHT